MKFGWCAVAILAALYLLAAIVLSVVYQYVLTQQILISGGVLFAGITRWERAHVNVESAVTR